MARHRTFLSLWMLKAVSSRPKHTLFLSRLDIMFPFPILGLVKSFLIKMMWAPLSNIGWSMTKYRLTSPLTHSYLFLFISLTILSWDWPISAAIALLWFWMCSGILLMWAGNSGFWSQSRLEKRTKQTAIKLLHQLGSPYSTSKLGIAPIRPVSLMLITICVWNAKSPIVSFVKKSTNVDNVRKAIMQIKINYAKSAH